MILSVSEVTMPEDNLAQFKQIIAKLPEDKRKLLYKRLHDMPTSEREAFIGEFVKKYNSTAKKPVSGSVKKTSANAPVSKSDKKPASQGAPSTAKSGKKPAPQGGSYAVKSGKKPSSQGSSSAANSGRKPSAQGSAAPASKKAQQQSKNVPAKSEHSTEHKQEKAQEHKPEQKQESKKHPAEHIPEHRPEPEQAPESEPKKASSSQSIILGIIVAVFLVGALYFVYLFNKQNIDNKFNEAFGMPASETTETTEESDGIMGPEPRHFPTNTPTPIPATPTPAPVVLRDDHPDLSGLVIVLDPGHQAEYDHELEESIPGTTAEKERATTGATGIDSGAKEYEITLRYALIMKEYLEGCGAEVILTREENEVNISNIERANIAVENNADYFIRIHADSAPDSEISGVKVYVPSTGKYSSSAVSDGKDLAEKVAEAIGSTSLGVVQSNMYTGLNHADSVKSYQLVVGYLSNSDDDALLGKEETAYNTAVAVSEFLAE